MTRYSITAFLFAILICVCSSISVAVANSLLLRDTSAIHLAAQRETAIANKTVSLATKSESLINQQQLRSAYLLRFRGDAKRPAIQNAGVIRLELQSHFDLVVDLLEENRNQSIEIALDRLEKHQGIRWTEQKRQLWRYQLAEQRKQNIAHLEAYRQRGIFPLHEGQAAGPVPIFVDKHDTACAVGHLMRCSGWHREVEFIAATDLLVYVPDVNEGPLVDWILTSGLTQEEAALIQPSYQPPVATTRIRELAGSDMSLDVSASWFDGSTTQDASLIYENFRWGAFVDEGWQFHSPVTPLIRHEPSSYIFGDSGTRIDYQRVFAFGNPLDQYIASYAPNWPHANIISLVPDGFDVDDPQNFLDTGFRISGSVPEFHIISFDIVSPNPLLKIDRVGVWAPAGLNAYSFQAETLVVTPATDVIYQTTGDTPSFFPIPSPDAPLGTLNAELNAFFFDGLNEDSAIFEGRDRVTVHTLIQGQRFGTLSHTVRLVAASESFPIGDVSLDGTVNFLDIAPFITLLTTGSFQIEADINQSGTVDFLDITPFIAILGEQ